MSYASFLASKRIVATPAGFEPTLALNPLLKPFQAECVTRALIRGRSALFAGTGLGKSFIEMEWARHVAVKTGKPVILLTPLAVSKQFEREAVKFGIEGVKACRYPNEAGSSRVVITNYERLQHFDPSMYGGIVIDESSILKAFEGSVRKAITEFARTIPYRLAATATPAPNDLIELTNHAELLDVLTGKEIIALFFTQDGNTTQKWRLKGHAREAFWRWLASWVTALRSPSDLGFSDEGYILPELRMHEHTSESPCLPGYFIPIDAKSLQERQSARRISLPERVNGVAELVAQYPDDPWILWCDFNAEAEALVKSIPGSMECRGTDAPEEKEEKLAAFSDGRLRVLVTKPKIAGFGLNWQHCCKSSFVGVSDSFEQQFQAIRRIYRFGQTKPVDIHLFVSESEGLVMENLKRKERQASEMFAELVKHMTAVDGQTKRSVSPYDPKVRMTIPKWLRSEVAV